MVKMTNRELAVKIGSNNKLSEDTHIECIDIILKTTFALNVYNKRRCPTDDESSALVAVVSAFINEIKDITNDYSKYKNKLKMFEEKVM